MSSRTKTERPWVPITRSWSRGWTKSTLWKNPLIRFFLDLAAAIPVFRRQDPGVDTSKNADMFAACHEVLRAGGTIALFPEGTSHNEPALLPLKTGVSRIVLEAEQKYKTDTGRTEDSGRIESRIVPVGLTFDDKGRFRSRVLVHIGEPVDPGDELELYESDPREAVRQLTGGATLTEIQPPRLAIPARFAGSTPWPTPPR